MTQSVGARALGFAGFNCSLPHKVAVIPHLDGLGESAEIMGAVNCVVRREGLLIGENTDGKGFLKSLRAKLDPAGKRLVILGAGGAARAIAVEVALAGAANVTIVNRNRARGESLAQLLKDRTHAKSAFVAWDTTFRVPPDADVLVNATSVGLFPDVDARLNIDWATLRPPLVVADVIPNPLRTCLIEEGQTRQCTVIDGLGMLVNQGVVSIKYWTGVDVDPTVMRDRVIRVLGID